MKQAEWKLSSLPLGKKLTIAVDVDGTVADYSIVNFNRKK